MNKKALPFLLPIRCVVFIIIFVVGAKIVNKDVSDISNWWSVAATVVNVLNIGLLIAVAKRNNQTYRQLINYEKGKTKGSDIVKGILLVLIVGMAGMYLAGFICYGVFPYMAPMMIAPIAKPLAIVNVVLLPITTALAEDGLYLGYGVNRIKNKYAATLVPAFFFALQHCFIPTLFDIRYILYRFLSFLPLTVILCRCYYKKRNPLPIMIGHALIDVSTVMLILATSLSPGLYEKMSNM